MAKIPARKLKKMIVFGGAGFLLLLGILHARSEVTMAGSEATRFAVVRAVAEQNTLAIDGEVFRTVDRVIRDGKVYSDKPPLLPVMIGLGYKAPHLLCGISFETHYSLSIYFVNLLVFTSINILLFLLFFRRLLPLRGDLAVKGLLALLLTSGTWLFTYSVTINNHTPAALLLWVWFLALDRGGRGRPVPAALGAGLAAGFAAAIEIPVGLVIGAAGLPAVWLLTARPDRGKALLAYCGGAALVGAAAGSLNFAAYGTLLPLYLGGGGTFSPGIGGKSLWFYAFETLFGRRGLFSYQPLLLAAIPMLYRWRELRTAERALAASGIGIMLFYIVFTNEYGGWSYGFRYAVAAIPAFGYLAARWLLPRCRKRRSLLLPAALLGAIGVAAAMVGAYNPFGNFYENDERSPAGSIHYEFKNSFTGNLLARSFERAPEGRLTRALFDFYGEKAALLYLREAYINTKNLDALALLSGYLERHYPIRR